MMRVSMLRVPKRGSGNIVVAAEDWVADESLDPFGDGGFEIHNDSA
jgi:hypothetical protein